MRWPPAPLLPANCSVMSPGVQALALDGRFGNAGVGTGRYGGAGLLIHGTAPVRLTGPAVETPEAEQPAAIVVKATAMAAVADFASLVHGFSNCLRGGMSL